MINELLLKFGIALIVVIIIIILKKKGIIKIKHKFKEEKEEPKNWLKEAFNSFVGFGTTIVLFGLFYFGALDAKYNLNYLPKFLGNVSYATNLAGEKVITTFYDVGYKDPNTFILAWWVMIAAWIFWIGFDLFKYFKERSNNVQK